MFRWIRNLAASVIFGLASSAKPLLNADILVPSFPLEPVETPLRRRYQKEVTICGGPGSQDIGATFDALPENVRRAMIAARGNTKADRLRLIRGEGEESGLKDFPLAPQETANAKISRGVARALGRAPGIYARDRTGKLVRTAQSDSEPRIPTDGQVGV